MTIANLFLSILPVQASTVAKNVDIAFWVVNIICIISFILVEGALIYFVIRYRRKKGEADKETPYLTHNTTAEIIWTGIPTLILVVIFYFGISSFLEMRNMPSDAEIIEVTGRQWVWDFKYSSICERDAKSGKEVCAQESTINVNPDSSSKKDFTQDTAQKLQKLLVVEKGKKYVLSMTSTDVIHSFFVPAFRVKQDVVPGLNTKIWFQAVQSGEFVIYCTEYCGKDHSGMLGKVAVLESSQYADWKTAKVAELKTALSNALKGPKDEKALIAEGQSLFTSKGCMACHDMKGIRKVGPPLNGLLAKGKEQTTAGEVVIDNAYLKESILKPMAKIVKGYPPAMGPQPINSEQADALVAYIKSVK